MVWTAQPGPQADAISATWCPMLFFGGARGGGKSDYLLGDFAQSVERYGQHWQGILFRRTFPELAELVTRARELFPSAKWNEQKRNLSFENGAVLRFRYLEHSSDYMRYQGHQFTWIGFDELPQWVTLDHFKAMIACLRSGSADIPTKRIRATGNPGGPGHGEVKGYFIDHAPRGYVPLDDADTRMARMFIPSRVYDNKILLSRDPDYIHRLKGVGSAALVRAWLEGDWTAVQGAFFSEFGDRHIMAPRALPSHWTRLRGYDHGYASPACVLWGCVSSGRDDKGNNSDIPKGAVVIYRELYPRRLTIPQIANEIKNVQPEKVTDSVADPSIFKHEGGPSIQEQFWDNGVEFRAADNTRGAGWLQIRKRLQPDVPALYIFTTCTNLLRTLPSLQHDAKKAEDLDTDQEDHAADALRYLCMARPYETHLLPSKLPAVRMGKVDVDGYVKSIRRELGRPRI